MALYGVLQAVDGVDLKQAVNAWASAENGDKAVRFAAAKTVRWLEWAVRSYQSFLFGLALILFGVAIAVTGRVSRPIGHLMALSGLCYLAQGSRVVVLLGDGCRHPGPAGCRVLEQLAGGR